MKSIDRYNTKTPDSRVAAVLSGLARWRYSGLWRLALALPITCVWSVPVLATDIALDDNRANDSGSPDARISDNPVIPTDDRPIVLGDTPDAIDDAAEPVQRDDDDSNNDSGSDLGDSPDFWTQPDEDPSLHAATPDIRGLDTESWRDDASEPAGLDNGTTRLRARSTHAYDRRATSAIEPGRAGEGGNTVTGSLGTRTDGQRDGAANRLAGARTAGRIGRDEEFGFDGLRDGGCAFDDDGGVGGDVFESEPAASVFDRPSGPEPVRRRTLHASVSGSETFSDNINLVDNDRARSDFVTLVAPRLDGCSRGGRIQGQASYQLQGVVYANNSQYNDVYNEVSASTTIDLIEQHFYLDAETNYGQAIIDPGIAYGRADIIRPNRNQTTAWRSNISPYWRQSLGDLGNGVLRYRYGRAVYDDDDVPDTTIQSVYGALTSPADVAPWSWQAYGTTQWVDQSRGDASGFYDRLSDLVARDVTPGALQNADKTQYFDTAALQLGYQLSSHLQVTALGGVEDRYRDDGRNDRWSAPRWQLGLGYATAMTTLEADVGHRFYGTSYQVSLFHRMSRSDVRLTYEEDPSTAGLGALGDVSSNARFGSVGSIDNLLGYSGRDNYDGDGNSLFNRSVYVQKSWNLETNFHTALINTTLRGFLTNRDALTDSGANERVYGTDVSARYALRPRISIVPSGRWIHYEDAVADVGDSNRYETGISVVRAVTRTAQAAIGYSHDWSRGGVDYDENRVTLQFRKSF